MQETATAKQALRREMTRRRDAADPAARASWSDAACARAISVLEADAPASVMLYAPFRSELDTGPLMAWAWRQEIGVIVPKCNPEDRSMRLYFIAEPEQLKPGAYGIPEPDPETASPCPADYVPGAVFVPGLAFDRGGGRLGYGGGYYDRFRDRLKAAAERSGRAMPPWIGLGYGIQLVAAALPTEAHDARLDGVVTESGTHEAG